MAVTVYDIARLAHTSQGTVSRALRNDGRLSLKTRQRIQAVARKLNYSPNHTATALRTGRTHTIGILCPHVLSSTGRLDEAEKTASEHGLSITLEMARFTAGGDQDAVRFLLSRRVDGLLLLGILLDDSWRVVLDEIASSGIPLVLIGATILDSPVCSHCIDWDRTDAYRQIANHLLDQGCRRFVSLGNDLLTPGQRMRVDGVRLAIAQDTKKRAELRLVHGTGSGQPQEMRSAVERALGPLLDQRWPDAVIAPTDLAALAVLDVARSRGIRCPQDLAVTGCSDTAFGAMVHPALTSIRMPDRDMAREAVLRLIQRIKEPTTTPPACSQTFPGQIVLRQSSLLGQTL